MPIKNTMMVVVGLNCSICRLLDNCSGETSNGRLLDGAANDDIESDGVINNGTSDVLIALSIAKARCCRCNKDRSCVGGTKAALLLLSEYFLAKCGWHITSDGNTE